MAAHAIHNLIDIFVYVQEDLAETDVKENVHSVIQIRAKILEFV